MKEKNQPEPAEDQKARHNIRLPGFLVEKEIGLGQVIKKVTYAMGIPTCGGCERRAAKLDSWIRFTR